MRPTYAVTYPKAPTPVSSFSSSESSRHLSQASSTGSAQAGSENWETFSEQSDEAAESDVELQNYRQSQMKRNSPDFASTPRIIQGKKIRGIRSVDNGNMVDQNGRIVRCSEAGWTDDGSVY
jgi:protein regulator of cytokinesis 1